MSALSEDVHCSPNTVRVTKSRRMGRAGHFTRIGGEQVYTGFWWGNLRERDHLGGPGRIWEDTIKLDLQEVRSENLRVPLNAGGFYSQAENRLVSQGGLCSMVY